MRQDSRIVVVDSTRAGLARPLRHSVYSIVYVPHWLRLRSTFRWTETESILSSVGTMREYFIAGQVEDRPYRAQRCLYSLKALHIDGLKKDSTARFNPAMRELLTKRYDEVSEYLIHNPVVAWDWVVTWAECRAMAEAFPEEHVKMFRRLRSLYGTKRKPKPELAYFLDILKTVAEEKNIDMEFKWKK